MSIKIVKDCKRVLEIVSLLNRKLAKGEGKKIAQLIVRTNMTNEEIVEKLNAA